MEIDDDDISTIDFENSITNEDEESDIKLLNTDFHANQKYEEENTKKLSWNRNNIFVCNNNRTGLIYFTITKKEGVSPPCYLQMLAPKEYHEKYNDLKMKTYRSSYLKKKNTTNVVMLYTLSECEYDEIPSDINIIGGNNRGLHNWNKINVSEIINLSDDEQNYVLATKEIIFPHKKGKYLVLIYPMMGLNTNSRDYNKSLQKISLIFPYEAPFNAFGGIRESFDTNLFRMVSKDPLDAKRKYNVIK